jgi:hypothetical protein
MVTVHPKATVRSMGSGPTRGQMHQPKSQAEPKSKNLVYFLTRSVSALLPQNGITLTEAVYNVFIMCL